MANKKFAIGCLGILVLGLVIAALWGIGSYNSLVELDQGLRSSGPGRERLPAAGRPGAQPGRDRQGRGRLRERHLHRRDRGPGQGRPDPRSTPGQLNDPAAFAKFQQAQDGLSSALSRLMVVVEKYPELKATQNFRDLQAQLEGTENRITVERSASTRPPRPSTPSG